MFKIIMLVISIIGFSVSAFAANPYSSVVKITAIESQGDDIGIYVSNGAIPQNPAECIYGSVTQLFLNNDSGTQRSFSALLAAMTTMSDVQLLLSSTSCRHDKRVIIGVRAHQK